MSQQSPSSLEVTDAQSAAVQKTPNRVPLVKIEELIAMEYIFTGGDAIRGMGLPDVKSLDHVTYCVLVFKNGYASIGQSAPADPANFNPEVGRKFAREDAIRKMWPVLGYEMCSKIAAEKTV